MVNMINNIPSKYQQVSTVQCTAVVQDNHTELLAWLWTLGLVSFQMLIESKILITPMHIVLNQTLIKIMITPVRFNLVYM